MRWSSAYPTLTPLGCGQIGCGHGGLALVSGVAVGDLRRRLLAGAAAGGPHRHTRAGEAEVGEEALARRRYRDLDLVGLDRPQRPLGDLLRGRGAEPRRRVRP